MIVKKKNIGTENSPKFRPDIPEHLEGKVNTRYRPETDDYELTFIESVTTEKWRLEIILEEDGLLDSINAAVSQADSRTQKAWSKAPSINRYSNALERIRKGLGLTHEQVDDIFERANAIEI